MQRGENIKSELQKVIKASRMSIVIFSKDYAYSTWCLDELAMILQHKRTSSDSYHVLPIFYDVDPSHVRRQMGSFKEAFDSYEEGKRENGWGSRVDGWKAALREAADLAGMHLQNDANGKPFGEEKKLEMHQLVQEMGREIVRQESPKDPGNRSRIWDNKDSLHILQEKSATAKVEGFILNIQNSENRNLDGSKKRKFEEAFNKSFFQNLDNWFTRTTSGNSCEMAFETEAFVVMHNLKFLVFNYLQLNGSYKKFSQRVEMVVLA
ncbi:hypothetical protein NMG60_11024295 [Bertholletia excelsa]